VGQIPFQSATATRVLAEIGDDRSRFQDAKGLKAYAGAASITRASGKTKSVTHRRVNNNRLNAAGYTWAFSALTASPAPAPTTAGATNTATGTPPPSATCSAGSSGACGPA
jgi:Transposase IS116/IS110/IS902 family